MEDVDFRFYVKLLFTYLVFVFLVPKIASGKRSKKLNLPPGPWKLPVIGNLHQLFHSLLHHSLRDLAKKHGDLMHVQLGELSYVVVSSAEVAREMTRNHDANFSQRSSFYDFKGLVFAPYGDYWRQMRKLCVQELLSPARVRTFRSIREEEVSSLIEYLHSASGTPINLSKKIFAMSYGITAKAAFGKKCKEQEAFIYAIKNILAIIGGQSIFELFPSRNWLQRITRFWPRIEEHSKIVHRILQDIIDDSRSERASKSSKDKSLLDVLLDIQENGNLAAPLETQNVKAVIMDMFVAGSDTSSITVEWALFELSRNPEVMEKAQLEVRRLLGEEGKIDETRLHELKYLNFVIKETLRLHPPVPLLVPREARESCVINGYDIPAKTNIFVNAWAIGRDSRYWSHPEKFDPERFSDSKVDFKGTNFELIPFGSGRRMCPGVSFAMHNVELPLAHLLFHFDWKLPDGVDAYKNEDVIESSGVAVRLKKDLYLIPVPCSTASL